MAIYRGGCGVSKSASLFVNKSIVVGSEVSFVVSTVVRACWHCVHVCMHIIFLGFK